MTEYIVSHQHAQERGFFCIDSAIERVTALEGYGATNVCVFALDSDGNYEQVA